MSCHDTRVMLVIRTGIERKEHIVPITLDEMLEHELSEPMELSDEPFSLLLDSLARGESTTEVRRRVFKMRRDVATRMTKLLIDALVAHFGRDDKIDGYRKDELGEPT